MQVKKEIISDFIVGQEVVLFTISTSENESISITNFGGIVHSWFCKDNKGQIADVLLGCASIHDYLDRHPYFGCIVGRYANRIALGCFSLDGKKYSLNTNLNGHHLHGGYLGFDRKVWSPELITFDDQVQIILTSTSCDGEEGYPGNLNLKIIYTYTSLNELIIEYFANTDQPTPINLTNHCYFNLSGDQNRTIIDHMIFIRSKFITEADKDLIPTGNDKSIIGSILDFSTCTSLSKGLMMMPMELSISKGYDHNYILEPATFTTPAAVVIHPDSGRRMQIFTDQPGIQLYTGNWLSGVKGKSGMYCDYAGLCLETQHFPDSPNHPLFPNTILRPNDQYYTKTIYKIDINAKS